MAMLRSLLLLFTVFSMGNADGNQDIYLYKPSLYSILKACFAKPLAFCNFMERDSRKYTVLY